MTFHAIHYWDIATVRLSLSGILQDMDTIMEDINLCLLTTTPTKIPILGDDLSCLLIERILSYWWFMSIENS